MSEPRVPGGKRRIRRAMLLTCGPAAEAVAETTMALSRGWLGVDPPLAVEAWRPRSQQPVQSQSCDELRTDSASAEPVCAGRLRNGCSDFQSPGSGWPLLDEACAGLMSGPRIAALRAAGWELARGDEIQGWLLVDVAAAGAAPGTLGVLLPLLAERVWDQARVHVVWRGLVLAEPALEGQAAGWVAELAAAGVEGVIVAGPVDAARLRWAPDSWQGRTATALAALLWGEADALNHAGLAAAGAAVIAWSVGATAWMTPLAQIQAQVALRAARLLLAQWLATPGQPTVRLGHPELADGVNMPPWEVPGLTVAPEQLRSALEAGVAPAPDGCLWAQRRPAWLAVHGLADALQATAEQHVAPAKAEQYEQRGAWLGAQVATWETALAGLRRLRLRPEAGAPQLRLFALELQGLNVQLQAACLRVEDWLDAAGRQYERATLGVQSAHQALVVLCAAFPAATAVGLRAALRGLWRWPGLAWAYLLLLPRAAQRYLDACARQWQARRTEANTHALRQAYLALAQAVQAQLSEVAALLGLVEQIADELALREEAAGSVPAPWDAARLDQLAARLLPALPVGLPDMLAGEDWADAAAVDGATAADRLLVCVARRLHTLLPWSAADCLAEGLDEAGLARWLTRQAAEATPLWPGAGAEAAAPVWLLTPLRAEAPGGPSALGAGRLEAAFQAAWTDGQKGMQARVGRTHADGVLLLRLAPVQLELKQEAI